MRKNTGREFEQLVAMIQESLKDSPDTEVFHNYFIKDKSSSQKERQFDVFIKSRIDDIIINIAIECKDYSSPVTVEKIEAFHSKCLTIDQIHRKIIIAASGFQSGGIENAVEFFDIELYVLSKIDKSIVKSWIDLNGIRRIAGTHKPLKYFLRLNNNIIAEADTELMPLNSRVTTLNGEIATLADVFENTLKAYDNDISQRFALGLYKANLTNVEREIILYNYYYSIGDPEQMWLEDESKKKYFISEFRVLLEFKARVKIATKTNAKEFKRLNENTQANIISMSFSNKEDNLHIVKTHISDEVDAYFIDNLGNVIKLEGGLMLDGETGEIKNYEK